MKLAGLIVALALLAFAPLTRAQGLNWEIDSYDIDIQVQPDGALDITERIVADFSREPHHGIYRDIPVAYRRHGSAYRVRLDVLGVTDDAGAAHPYRIMSADGQLRIRIGSPDRKVSAPTTYVIAYRVRRAMLDLAQHDELYWNAIGPNWAIPIEQATCAVRLPPGVSPDAIRTASFLGPEGSTTAGPEAQLTPDGAVRFAVDRRIRPWTAFTIVIGLPKGAIDYPGPAQRAGWFLADNGVLAAPVVAFIALWLLWRNFGRDRGQPRAIAVQYEPPDGMTPLEVGALIDERADPHDITATIVDLAVRGYLRFDVTQAHGRKPDPDETRLIRTDKPDGDLLPFEKTIMRKLFSQGDDTTLEDLQNRFYSVIPTIKSSVYGRLSAAGYFDGHLESVRRRWLGLGIFAAAATIGIGFLLVQLLGMAPVPTWIAAALTAPLFIIFAAIMPRKTVRGRRALESIKGLEEYISRAELPQIELAARQHHFEKLLPYALALGLARKWGAKFEGLYEQPPQWYQGRPDVFTVAWLTSGLMHSSSSVTSTIVSQPRSSGSGAGGGSSGFSSGGGFSGGGFGGGGGGGW